MGIEARIDAAQGDKCADEQRRANEQNQRQRDFADDEQGPSLALAEAGAGAAAAFFERGVEVGSRGADGGKEPEEDSGEKGNGEGECEDTPVNSDRSAVFSNAGKAGGTDGKQGADSSEAKSQAKHAAGYGEQHALSEQLADDARAASAERGADGEFAFAPGGTDKKEIGDIGACN